MIKLPVGALLAALALAPVLAPIMAGIARAEPQTYQIDTSHSQVLFSFNHHGFADVVGMLGGVTGTIVFDRENPAASSTDVKLPLASLTTGLAARDQDILSEDFLGAEKAPEVTFRSTAIRVVAGDRALITGDLSLNGVTRPVVLDTVLNRDAPSVKGRPTLGLHATTTLLRSDFGAGRAAPSNSDLVEVKLFIEAQAEGAE